MSRDTDARTGIRSLGNVVLLLVATTLVMSFSPEDFSARDPVPAPQAVEAQTIEPQSVEAQAEPEAELPQLTLRGTQEGIDAVPFATTMSTFALECAMSARARINRWDPLIEEASERFGVPRTWIRAVLKRESDGRTVMKGDRPLRSRAGAMGLMQLMPETWAELRDKYGLGSNPHDPHDNVFAGTAYLSDLKARYGYPAMFIAYNHGPGNLERHLATNNTLPRETRDYVAAITANLGTSRTEPRRRAMQRAGTPALRLASFIAAD